MEKLLNLKTLGSKLKKKRRESGLTQKECASLLKCHSPMISHLD